MPLAYRSFVKAKDTKHKLVLLGGLGCMGVGTTIDNFYEVHKEYPGFDIAPDINLKY